MQDRYDPIEFETITYMASSGGLSCPDSDARQAYYGNNGLPHLVFNGTTLIVGAGTDAIDGSVYDPIVQSMLDDPTPLSMEISAYSWDEEWVEINLVLAQDMPDISHLFLRVLLIEDDLTYSGTRYYNIVRDLLPDIPVTIDEALEVQDETVNFTLDPTWNPANMRIVAFVQDDDTKHIYQTCNSQPTPEYSLRYYSTGERVVVADGDHTFGEAFLFNSGLQTDTYTISLDTSALPAGWSAHFTIDDGDYTSYDVVLAPDESIGFTVTVVPSGDGQGDVALNFHSQSEQIADRHLDYSVITSGTRILVVDDDGAYDYETQYFAPAIAATGESFAIWNRNAATVDGPLLANFDVVIWQCGWAFPTVDDGDRAALAAYLDGGGNLFITGQDIGWEMNDIGGSAIAWYHDYLHANYISDDTNDLTLDGVPGDEIGDGLSLVIGGGDGANNQEYPSDIDPRDAFGSVVFRYDASRNGAIKVDTGAYKVVYFAFGYEAINNAADREVVMERILDWLLPTANDVSGGGLPQAVQLVGNMPNPFNPRTEIVFRLDRDAEVALAVYDLAGRRICDLGGGQRVAGEHRVVWDGRDDHDRAMPAGTYFYRLTGAGTSQTGKMALVR